MLVANASSDEASARPGSACFCSCQQQVRHLYTLSPLEERVLDIAKEMHRSTLACFCRPRICATRKPDVQLHSFIGADVSAWSGPAMHRERISQSLCPHAASTSR